MIVQDAESINCCVTKFTETLNTLADPFLVKRYLQNVSTLTRFLKELIGFMMNVKQRRETICYHFMIMIIIRMYRQGKICVIKSYITEYYKKKEKQIY